MFEWTFESARNGVNYVKTTLCGSVDFVNSMWKSVCDAFYIFIINLVDHCNAPVARAWFSIPFPQFAFRVSTETRYSYFQIFTLLPFLFYISSCSLPLWFYDSHVRAPLSVRIYMCNIYSMELFIEMHKCNLSL